MYKRMYTDANGNLHRESWYSGKETDAKVKEVSEAEVKKQLTDALTNLTTLPYGGSKEWLEANGDTAQLYQIDGYVWGYVESDGWTKSGTRFLIVKHETYMTNVGGTPYLLRPTGVSTGVVYAYTEASGDAGIPVYDTKPTTANEGDIIAVGGRKYKASVTETQVPNISKNYADPTSSEWLNDHRCNSSGTTAFVGLTVTNIIEVPANTNFYVTGIDLETPVNGQTPKQQLHAIRGTVNSNGNLVEVAWYEGKDGGVYTFKNANSSERWYRFCGTPTNGNENVIITVGEEITYRIETVVTWTDIGEYIAPVEAGWNATEETYAVIDSLTASANIGASAVYSADGYIYSYIAGAGWMAMSKYHVPTLAIDGELSDSSENAVQNKVVKAAIDAVDVKATSNASEITAINERITNIETGSGTVSIPSWWQSAVDECVSKIKALQVGRNCVTFPFFSDNHTRDGKAQYMGLLIAHVMKECGIPYCFCGGDAITSALASTADSDAEFRAQAKAFHAAMSYIPDGRFCMALGNHEGYLKQNANVEGSTTVTYDRDQTYEIFMRENSTAQNKHFGGDGTYYYVDDLPSKVRWIVLNTNGIGNSAIDSTQLSWFENTALKFNESGWGVVIISHIPITNHYEQSNITNASTVISMVQSYMSGSDANKADIIGWYSGHIHRDRFYKGMSVNNTDDSVGEDMGFTQVTITSDHTAIAYPVGNSPTTHPIDNSDKSHAIDFVTINKSTRTVNITRLGIGEDRSYTY